MGPKNEYPYYLGATLPLVRDSPKLLTLSWAAASSMWREEIILGYRFSFYLNPKATQQPEVLRPQQMQHNETLILSNHLTTYIDPWYLCRLSQNESSFPLFTLQPPSHGKSQWHQEHWKTMNKTALTCMRCCEFRLHTFSLLDPQTPIPWHSPKEIC